MSVEWFYKLKEIDSLTKMRIKHLNEMREQEDRLSKLRERRQLAIDQSASLNQSIMGLQQKMFELDQKLKSASEQKQRIADVGGDDAKILEYQKNIDQMEEDGLVVLEEIEAAQQEIADSKTFLAGLEKTYAEISDEVASSNAVHDKEVKNFELRISLLQEELPSEFQQLLTKTLAKKLANGPFTRIIDGACFLCRYKISRQDESEVDMQQRLKVCPQCTRIFLPYGA